MRTDHSMLPEEGVNLCGVC